MIIVMGLPGAGKSTVLQSLSQKTDYKIINYGDLMLEIEKKEGWVKTRDEIRKLSIEKQKQAQKLVANKLSKEKGKLILDTHCSISTPNGYYPGLPFEFLKMLRVDNLIYVTAKPDEIVARRKGDATRIRDAQPLEAIIEHGNMDRYYLAAYSAFTGAPAIIIYNQQGKLENTVEKLSSMLK